MTETLYEFEQTPDVMNSSDRISRRRALRFGGAAVSIGLAGCTGSQVGPGGQSETDVSLLLDWKANATQVGHFIAKEKDFFETEGLSVELTGGKGGQSTAKQVALGKYDLGLTSAAAVLQTRAKDQPLRAFAAAQQGPNSTVYTATEVFGEELVRPKQLAGKTVAIPAAASNLALLKTVLRERNIAEKVTFLNVGWGQLTPSILDGEADAALGAFPDGIAMDRNGYRGSQLWLSDYVTTVGRSIVTRPSFAEENSDTLRSFLRADARGWAWAASDPEAAMDRMIDAVPRLSESRELGVIKIERTAEKLLMTDVVRNHGWGHHSEGAYAEINRALASADMLSGDLEPEKAYSNAFLENGEGYIENFANRVAGD